MERTAVHGRLNWQLARVVEGVTETARTKSIALDAIGWPGHLAGQHVDVRLTADDGYQAQRSYSIASAPEDEHLVITVQRLENGEVSPYLTETLVPGDELELRGPIGGYFVWQPGDGGPLFLAAGGSGLVPLMAMVRARIGGGGHVPVRLLVSSRSPDEAIYAGELGTIATDQAGVEVIQTFTRAQPSGWTGYRRRVDREMLAEVAWPATDRPRCYVCGPTGFVEAVANSLVELGHKPQDIRTERFGPTGG